MSALAGIAGVLGGISGVGSLITSGLNYGAQQDTLAWQKAAQEKTWAREDTAVQRRMQDLETSGLSKTLAAGSSATTGSPIHLDTPQISPDMANAPLKGLSTAQAVMGLMRQKADISQVNAQTALTKLQQEKAKVDTLQTLANTEGMGYKNQVAQATVQDSIQGIKTEVSRSGLAETAQKYDNIIKRYQSQGGLDETIKQKALTTAQQAQNLNAGEKKLLAQDLAIKMASTNLEEKKHNLEIYKEVNMPTNMGFDKLSRAGMGLYNLLDKKIDFSEWGKKKIPPIDKSSDYKADQRRYGK